VAHSVTPSCRSVASRFSIYIASHGYCANAVGAAIAQVSGEADQVFCELSRDEAIAAARGIAEDRAVQAGAARASLKTVDVEDMPITYLPGNALRVRVRVAGDLVKPEVPAAA
jgi:hypothetical protein